MRRVRIASRRRSVGAIDEVGSTTHAVGNHARLPDHECPADDALRDSLGCVRPRAPRWLALLLVVLVSASLPAQQDSSSTLSTEGSTQIFDPRFKLIPTKNLWTFLLLDPNNGRVWQVHYALKDSEFSGQLPVNESELAVPPFAHHGRFELRETQNIFNFLLVDLEDGRVWQLQWSNDDEKRGIVRILANAFP